jgi:FkbM family methyltransferase
MKKRRPHILKIDVEGFDYEVIKGFMRNSTLISELPLMIQFEVHVSSIRCYS